MDKKKKTVLIVIIIVVLLVLLLISFLIGIKHGGNGLGLDTKKRLTSLVVSDSLIPSSIRVSNDDIELVADCDDGQCLEGYSISDLSMLCYGNEGILEFNLTYTDESNPNAVIEAGYLKIFINGNPIIFHHDMLTANIPTKVIVGYEGYDLRNMSTYVIDFVGLDEYTLIHE